MKNEAEIFEIVFCFGLSFNKIWGISHGHFRNSWWFDMEWPCSKSINSVVTTGKYLDKVEIWF